MANLGFQTVYHILNSLPDCVCERAFMPEKGDIPEFQRTDTRLFSLESQLPLSAFDIIAFSTPFEEDYPNIAGILRLAHIPLYSRDRDNGYPLVIAGGAGPSINPEPIADFMDAFFIGEAEGFLEGVVEAFLDIRQCAKTRDAALKGLDSIPCVYVPGFYGFEYDGPCVKGVSINKGAKEKVISARNNSKDLGRHALPQSFIITPEAEFNGAFLIEVDRGCPRLCRFCVAGFLYLPPRWREVNMIKEAIEKGGRVAGKVGLIGAAVSEHPHIKDMLRSAISQDTEATLSSLRMDMLDPELLKLLKEAGYSTITVAPEAGTERMRNIVNKGMTQKEVMDSARLIRDAGFKRLKLYFLVGLPEETDADAGAIADLSMEIKGILGNAEVSLSINPFIPKPFTPLQWHAFEGMEAIEKRVSIIRDRLKRQRGLKVNALSTRLAFAQAYISRGDRRAGAFIEDAALFGWAKALRSHRGVMEGSLYRQRQKQERLPWDIIDHGVKKGFLWKEYENALHGKRTPPCNVGACFKCGVCAPS
jgi:radical SAM superfamily enzyme YgiQ (UPF0313 family)